MTGASKILTVSYGTFSCTLEGFDDPFNTMKAIAEYFRDLAAGDRYFGAEPPIPDAAMLHRIAEREIHRRVEAKIQDNGVILRAGDSDDLPAAEAPRPALLDADSTAESVAARLQRIRARHADKTVSDKIAAQVVTEAVDQPDAYSEDQHADTTLSLDLDALAPHPAAVNSAVIDIPDQIEVILDGAENDQTLAEFDDSLAELPEAVFDLPEALPEAQEMSGPASGLAVEPASVIAMPDQQPEIAAEEAMLVSLAADLSEDSVPEDDTPEDYAPVAGINGGLVDLPEDLAAPMVGFDEDDMLARLAVAEPLLDAEAELVETQQAANLDSADLDTDEDLTFEALASEAQAQQPAANPDAEIGLSDHAYEEPAATPTAEAAPPPAGRARARVIRIRRAEAVAAVPAAAGPVTDTTATALSEEAEAALQAELAALEAEIGEFATAQKADVAARSDADTSLELPVATSPEAAEEPLGEPFVEPSLEPVTEPAVVAHAPIAAPAEDEAVNRLMAQADSEMGGEENRRRQSAIAHLKAAVAATQADRAITGGRGAGAPDRMNAYRDDLERVVRPRRPVSEGTALRPAAQSDAAPRPTPLVLVSAQRIDLPQASATAGTAQPAARRVVMPVRPRRVTSMTETLPATSRAAAAQAPTASVSAALSTVVMQNPDQTAYDEDDILAPGETDNVFADATSFQDFADQLGASALPDLLEAAAVYCAEVLQRPEFSRPLVMRQIAGLAGQTETAREDYLRGFGTLLRQGRITKVKRGMFALTDRSPYLAEARKLAG